MKNLISIFFISLVSLFSSPLVMAGQADQISVKNPFAREVPPGSPTSASFMEIHNKGSKGIKLIGAKSSVAKVVELHTHINNHGVMRMRKLPFIAIPGPGKVHLKPGGLHVMLIGLHKPLKEGQQISVMLNFEDGSQKKVVMPVRSVKGMMHK